MIFSFDARFPPARHACRKTAALAGVGLAAVFAAVLAYAPAQAQYYERPDRFSYGDYDIPGADVIYPERLAGIPLGAIRQLAALRGLHLIATPRRKGRIYLAETEDARGIRHRLVVDAYEGHLLEDTVLGPKGPLPNPSRTTLPKPPQRPLADEPSKAVLDTANDKDKDKDRNKDQVKVDKPAKDAETTTPPPSPPAK
ncbi:MAG: hypothetical protein ACLQIQ_17595 [Beijerinckiaceae bacterium]